MQPLNRLFGKELTNILENKNHGIAGKAVHKSLSQIGPKYHTRNQSRLEYRMEEEPKNELQELTKKSSNQMAPESSSFENLTTSMGDQLVPCYLRECLEHMRWEEETKRSFHRNYMADQKQITANMRGILLDWLIDLHLKFRMFPETLFSVTMLIDRYLCKRQISKDNLQLLGATAFFIAAKYEETYHVPELKQLVHLSANAFSKKDVLALEADLIGALDFELIMTGSLKFMEPLVRLISMSQKNQHLTQYILQLALFDVNFLKYKPSTVACSAVYLVNKIRRVPEIWPEVLFEATGLTQKDIKPCAKELCLMFQGVDKMPNTKSIKKKFALPKFSEVAKIRLERREK